MTDLAEIRAEGRRLLAAWRARNSSTGAVTDVALEEMDVWLLRHADVLLADPDAVGLTEDERRLVEGLRKMVLQGFTPHEDAFAVLLAIIDRLSAAPVDDRERVPEGWRVEWSLPDDTNEEAWPFLVPVSPSVDPEEG